MLFELARIRYRQKLLTTPEGVERLIQQCKAAKFKEQRVGP